MTTLLQIDREELRAEIKDVVSEALRGFRPDVPETPKPDRIDTVDEVSEITGLSKSKIYKDSAAGLIPCARYGPRRLVFSRKQLEEWMAERTRPLGDSLDAITLTARRRANKRRA
jgi:excisionase family DNA binding protein